MTENRYIRFLMKLVMSFAVFLLVHYLMDTAVRHQPFVFNIMLDVIAPVFFAAADSEVERRSEKKRDRRDRHQ